MPHTISPKEGEPRQGERHPSPGVGQPDPGARPIAPRSPLRPQADEPSEPRPDAAPVPRPRQT
jgi:hypothetical protein